MSNTPKVFISYSHDSDDHKKWTLRLAADLRRNGVDATLDQWDLGPGADLAAFMEKGVTEAHRVLAICTPRYVQKANAGEGGVGYEKMIVTAELVRNLGSNKFIPIVRDSKGEKRVPIFLGARVYVDFDDDASYDDKLKELLHELHGHAMVEKPTLGTNPFVHHPNRDSSEITQSPTVTFVDSNWLTEERKFANSEFGKTGLNGRLEAWFGLETKLASNQKQLLDAVRTAQIKTFGWPIAVLLEDRDEYRPKPRKDGIHANVFVKKRATFDYWAARNCGDFYLLKSLFEDNRKPGNIFFDTRIVRTLEALMFCRRFYFALGATDSALVRFFTKYTGLKGRELTASNPHRILYERACSEDEIAADITFRLSEISENPVSLVKSLLDPLFVLFDFFQLSDEVYAEIVNKFVNGEVT